MGFKLINVLFDVVVNKCIFIVVVGLFFFLEYFCSGNFILCIIVKFMLIDIIVLGFLFI